MKLLLEKGAKVNHKNIDSRVTLGFAINREFEGMVKILLEHGASFEIEDNDGNSPVNYAVFVGKV